MKKFIAILIILFILTTGVAFRGWYQTNHLLETNTQKLAATETILDTTTTNLNTIEEKLVATEANLVITNEKLAATEGSLTTTKANLATTETTLKTTEKKLASALEEMITVQTQLALTWEELSFTGDELKLVLEGKAKAEARIAELIQAQPTLGLPGPEYRGTWDYSKAYPFLTSKFPGARILIRASVKLISLEDWQEFVIADNVNTNEYSMQDFNCTDYAEILQGKARTWAPASAFGIAVMERTGIDQPGYYHYLNFFIDETGKIWLLEPQNDTIFTPPTDWKYLLILL